MEEECKRRFESQRVLVEIQSQKYDRKIEEEEKEQRRKLSSS